MPGAKCFMYMISFNSYNNPVLSVLFIFILILEMSIKKLVKSHHGNLDILKLLMLPKSLKLGGKILKEEEGEKHSFKLVN